MSTYYFNLIEEEYKDIIETVRLKADNYDEACIKLYNGYSQVDDKVDNVEDLIVEDGKIMIDFTEFGAKIVAIRISEAEAMKSDEIIDIK